MDYRCRLRATRFVCTWFSRLGRSGVESMLRRSLQGSKQCFQDAWFHALVFQAASGQFHRLMAASSSQCSEQPLFVGVDRRSRCCDRSGGGFCPSSGAFSQRQPEASRRRRGICSWVMGIRLSSLTFQPTSTKMLKMAR